MRYDLKCMECNRVYYIECSLKEREKFIKCYELKEAIEENVVRQQVDSMPWDKLYHPPQSLGAVIHTARCYGILEVDFTTQKPIRHNINWPKTEDMK